MVLHASHLTSRVDERGYFILDRHVEVAIAMTGIKTIELSDFCEGAVVFHLEIARREDGYALQWTSSIGVEGLIVAAGLSFDLRPGDHLKRVG